MTNRKTLRVFTLGVLTMASVVEADTRIALSTDRQGTFDVYKVNDDGGTPVRVTDEAGQAHNPTIAPSGRKVIYDIGGALWMNDFDDPIGTPVLLDSGSDPDAGPYINTARDFRVIYTLGYGGNTEIWMATLDISAQELIDHVSLTPDADLDNWHPAFCGPDHFVWIRDDSYDGELCIQEFDAEGPVGEPTCWFDGFGDGVDAYPDCDSTGTYVAWARESSTYSGTHDIWTMETDGSGALAVQDSVDDETMPVWAPGDTQIAFAWNRIWVGSGHDYEIWKINADGTGDAPVTENDGYDDLEPSWGPAVLP